MRKFFLLIMVVLLSFGITIQDASAKRFGGGRSFGMSRSTSSYSSARPFASPGQALGANKNRWLAPLAGLAMGGLLASLFMGNGFGSGMLSWLLIAAIGLTVLNLIRRWQQQKMGVVAQQPMAQAAAANYFSSGAATYPAGFDADTFIRNAKATFFRLQAAYDQKNVNDLREFTSPEVFGEIQVQWHERGDEENRTEVDTLNAQLLDAKKDYQLMAGSELEYTVSSVRFSGLIRENSQTAAPFDEVWHFRKESSSAQWVVAGIQQH